MDVCEGVPQGAARVFLDGEEFPDMLEVRIETEPLRVTLVRETGDVTLQSTEEG